MCVPGVTIYRTNNPGCNSLTNLAHPSCQTPIDSVLAPSVDFSVIETVTNQLGLQINGFVYNQSTFIYKVLNDSRRRCEALCTIKNQPIPSEQT